MAATEPSSDPRAGRIRDAHGRWVTQLDPVALYLLRQHAPIDADVLTAIAHEKGVRITRRERASLIVGAGGVVLVAGLLITSLIVGDFADAPYARTSSLLLFCGMAWIYWIRAKRARFGNVAAAMLKYRRCPHCGYDLRMLPAHPADRTTECPECGCAWNLGPRAR